MTEWLRALGATLLLSLLSGLLLGSPALAQTTAVNGPAAAASAPALDDAALQRRTLWLNKRRIVTFQATLLGNAPEQRAELARLAFESAGVDQGPGQISRVAQGELLRFDVDGKPLFFLSGADFSGPQAAAEFERGALDVERRLRVAVLESRELHDPRRLALAAAYALVSTALAYGLLRLIFAARRRALARLAVRLADWQRQQPQLLAGYGEHAQSGAQYLATLLSWALALLLIDIWASHVLSLFAYTRPWGERSQDWLLGLLGQFAAAAASALPGLLTAALIFGLARLATRTNALLLARVERGELQLRWLDQDTAGPTRRLANVLIWLFALAMAYPYLPGANSEAFRGVTVLAGLMLSLGGSGLVGQAISGMSLMYSRTLRVGEYVRVGEVEGTVAAIGMFATRIHTGMGEEVSLPNAAVFSQPVRNFSRLVDDGQFMLQTAVTIGYGTPWRQVHALLLEAARRTPGVATEPAPYVVQTALSDFYVEYRLCAQGNRLAPRRRIEALNQLHGNIQDVFNENDVQIMSPHYRDDPASPQKVPPSLWNPPLAPAAVRPPAPHAAD
ncbi:mechanosensitive ion channel [Paucibacter sp. APW11]|uniref:Small-conductance mechanosensitive channel n=1 Tax=Roseateles aquae TaxID=3077235 RepID=A0ABU3PI06_9BURK|nr:mechanosensitive ion channel domain-containing protein [Paucibacter sp. APW11]MDT9002060.1 mechanosensitive ion channel [Paucibacter sp. APW11]